MIDAKDMRYATDIIETSVFHPAHEPLRKVVDALLKGPFWSCLTRAYVDEEHFVPGVRWGRVIFQVPLRREVKNFYAPVPIDERYWDGTPNALASRIEHDLVRRIHETERGWK